MPNAISKVTLYNCKLERTGHKTIDFTSASARDSFFNSNNSIATIYGTISSCTYIRENQTIKVGINADILDANGVNYCRFINPQFANRYYYAFVDDIVYIAPETSELHIRTDVFVTNIGSINFDYCFVEREHVADDSLFAHTLPEPIDGGQLVYKDEYYNNRLELDGTGSVNTNANYIALVMLASEVISKSPVVIVDTSNTDNYIGGDFIAGYYIGVDPENVQDFVTACQEVGMSVDNICFVKLIPRKYITLGVSAIINESTTTFPTTYKISDNGAAETITISPDYTHLYTHTIRNNKLNNYPYRAIRLTNFDGSRIDLQPQYLTDNRFRIIPATGANPNITIKALGYNYGDEMENSVETSDFGDCPYKTDEYLNYLAEHKNTYQLTKGLNNLSVASSVANAAQSVAVGNVPDVQGVGNSIINILQFNANIKDMQRIPPHMQGGNSANISRLNRCKGLGLYNMVIRDEYAEIVDSFFDMFGYNVSCLKLPQFNSRAHYNYLKTNGVNVFGQIPKNELQELASLFDTGVTVWHMSSGGTYGLYDTNSIV